MKRVKRDIWFLIIILIIIVVLEIVTNIISNKSVETISKKLDDIKGKIEVVENEDESEEIRQALIEMDELESSDKQNLEKLDKEIENIGNEIKDLKDSWFKEEKKLSFFSEHNELEKVSYPIIVLEENVKNHEYDEALNNIVEAKFWLEHFKEKDSFQLKNIF